MKNNKVWIAVVNTYDCCGAATTLVSVFDSKIKAIGYKNRWNSGYCSIVEREINKEDEI